GEVLREAREPATVVRALDERAHLGGGGRERLREPRGDVAEPGAARGEARGERARAGGVLEREAPELARAHEPDVAALRLRFGRHRLGRRGERREAREPAAAAAGGGEQGSRAVRARERQCAARDALARVLAR